MHKRILILVLIITLLSACTPASETPAPTRTQAPAATATRTSPPPTEMITPTHPPATATPTRRPTITPLIIPTRTPTPTPTSTFPFVYGLQPTLTPAAPALCPQISTTEPIPAPPSLPDATLEDTLAYLNAYGPALLRSAGNDTAYQFTILSEQDLTQDGVPEILGNSHLGGYFSPFVILGCQDGAYQVLFEQPTMDTIQGRYHTIDIIDANRNGLPEILFRTGTMSQGGHDYDVYEWDGSQFRSLLEEELWAEASGYAYFEDMDGDYLKELVLITGIPVWSIYLDGLPWRSDTEIYRWDGAIYRLERSDPDAPEYRFQALQDADYYTSLGEYARAQALYQAVIFDPLLGGWSEAQGDYLREVYSNEHYWGPTPSAPPPPDPNEYGHLAAYARFRLMLLHLLGGLDVSAQTVYDGLQAQFPQGTPGATFAEMAAEFWTAYQAGEGMGAACQAAVNYVTAHPEGLYYLGDWHHGFDSVSYKPAMVCPFK